MPRGRCHLEDADVKLPRWVRWLGSVLAILVLVIVILLTSAVYYFDRERVTRLVAAEVLDATGRQIHFDGEIGFRFLPTLALRLDAVRFANAPWGTQAEMLKARRLELDVELRPLLSKRLVVHHIALDGVELLLETDSTGRGNWVMQKKQDEQPDPVLSVDFDRLSIRDSAITFRDGRNGQREKLEMERVTISAGGTLDRVDAQILLRGQPITIAGHVGSLSRVLAGASTVPVDLAVNVKGAGVKSRGTVGLADDAGKASLDMEVAVHDKGALERLAGKALSLPLPLTFSAHLEQGRKSGKLSGIALTAGKQTLSGSAAFDLGSARPRFDLVAKAETFDLGALFPPRPEPATPPATPPTASGFFSEYSSKLAAPLPFDATVAVDVASLRLPGQPALNRFHARCAFARNSVKAQRVEFELDDGSRASGTAMLGLAENAGKASLDIDAVIRDKATLERLANKQLHLPMPLAFRGRIEQDHARSTVPAFTLIAGKNEISGRVAFDASAARPQLDLAARAKEFDLGDFLPPPASPAARTDQSSAGGRLFSESPLELPKPPAFDARIDLAAAKLQLPGRPALSGFHATLLFSNTLFKLQPLQFELGGGRLFGAATLRLPDDGVPAIGVHGHSDGIPLEDLRKLIGTKNDAPIFNGGRTEIRVDLETAGRTPRALARHLNGELLVRSEHMRLSDKLGRFDGDVFTRLAEAVNPLHKREKGSNVSCAVARLPVRDGVVAVDRSIALEGDRLNIVAAGTVDLGEETIDMAIHPAIKEGFGVGAASLAQLVKIGGSLPAPVIGINFKGMARTGLSVGAAVATGGLSLLGERLLTEGADPHPCLAAMNGRPPAAAAAAPGANGQARKERFRPFQRLRSGAR